MAGKSEMQGKTRIIPVPEWQSSRNNALKKVRRLAEKVEKLSKQNGFPPMGFFYIHGGQINVYGHRKACEEIFSEKNLQEMDPQIMEPECLGEGTVEEKKNADTIMTVDLRNIDLGINFSAVKVDDLRKIFSLILYNKGKGERSTYAEGRVPEFWPQDVPFVSHSKRRDDGRRVLSADLLVKCLEAFKEYCVEKIKSGWKPVNICSTLNLAKLMNNKEDEQMEEKEMVVEKKEMHEEEREMIEEEREMIEEEREIMVEEEKELVEEEKELVEEEKEMFEKEMVEEEKEMVIDQPFEEGDTRTVIDHLLMGNELTPDLVAAIRSTPVYQQAGKVDFQPRKKLLRSYKGPKELVPGEGHPSFWNTLSIFPDVSRIMLYMFANEHLDHYCCQYEAHKVTVEDLKDAFDNAASRASTVHDLLKEEALHLLTDAKPTLSTWMFFAGYLRSTLTLYTEKNIDAPFHMSACPCVEGDRETIYFYMDKGENYYPLSLRSLWCANNVNTRRVNVVEEVAQKCINTDESVGTLPGISCEKRSISRYNYTIYQQDINRIRNGEWLDDSVVNMLIRHLIEGHESSVQMLDSTFARALMVPKQANCLDDGTRLRFSTVNVAEGMVYTRRLAIHELDTIIIPICDNLHWFTVYFLPKQKKLMYVCSMGGRNLKVMNLLRSFFCEMLKIEKSEITFELPQVPKQQNGNDCGVYVILYAKSMIENEHIPMRIQGNRSPRQQVMDILNDVGQLCD